MQVWYKIIVSIPTEDPLVIDGIGSLFSEFKTIGTEIKNAFDYYSNDENLFGEIPVEIPLSRRNINTEVIGYFTDNSSKEAINRRIDELLITQNYKIEWQLLENQNWQENWMEYYQPQRMSRYLSIVPIWYQDYQAETLEQIIRLNPGIAFGTGYHPTSRLSAQALEVIMSGGEKVIDVGCGTGILSFVAGVLGASSVIGFDLDPQAVDAAQENLSYQDNPNIIELKNQQKIEFKVNNLLTGVNSEVNIIVANILPHILVNLFQDAYNLLSKDGYLVIGGILESKGNFIEKHINNHGFSVYYQSKMGDWLSYILKKVEDE